MDCKKVKSSLSAWLDGELSITQAKEIRKHIACCPLCQEEAMTLHSLYADIEKTPGVPFQEGFTTETVTYVLQQARTSQLFDVRQRLVPFFQGACLATVMIGISFRICPFSCLVPNEPSIP
jgi:Predicted transmembrane transcriptional regulator (anti-sigma factor)